MAEIFKEHGEQISFLHVGAVLMRMRYKILLGLFLFQNLLTAKEYLIVANKDIRSLSKEEVKAVYLKKIVYLNDHKLVPINLESGNKVRAAFEKDVLNMGYIRLKSYWTKQHYLGHRPPIIMRSQKSVKKFIQKVDGAIGYIEADKFENDLKVLYKWSDNAR